MKPCKAIFTLSLIIMLLVAFSATGFSLSAGELSQYKKKPIMAPEFTLQDLDGKVISLSDFRGKRIVVIETGSST